MFLSYFIGLLANRTIQSIQEKEYSKIMLFILSLLHGFILYILFIHTKEIFLCLLALLFLYMSYVDFKVKCIPTISLFIMGGLTLLLCGKDVNLYLYERLIEAFLGTLHLIVLYFIKRDSIGDGDIYFLLLLGFYLGYEGILIVEVISYILAFLYAILYHEKSHKIAMIPFFYISFLLYFLLFMH